MKLEIVKGSENYACQVIKLPPKQTVVGLDKLVKITYQGNDVLTQKDTDENQLYLFFPAECAISPEYLSVNNEYREFTLNKDRSQKGYFEPSGRVKAIKFKGVISTGYLAPISTLDEGYDVNWKNLKEGDEFTDIDGFNVCKKYKPVHIHATAGQSTESRFNKKLKRFNKLVKDQFRFHISTTHLAKSLHMFHPEDIIVITDKWHGTSAVFSNLLVNNELKWYEKLAIKLGLNLVTTKYDNLYSSRTVIKNQYINKDATNGFYGEDIWGVVDKEVKEKIEPGISLYGEIVGFLASGKAIQKGYDYGCDWSPGTVGTNLKVNGPEHKFLVYRITYTKPDGNVIEFSWQQIKNYCQKYQLEHVKELYFGSLFQLLPSLLGRLGIKYTEEDYRDKLFQGLSEYYLEKDCNYCVNKVSAEGIVVRRDGQETYSAYKLKSKRFLEHETKMIDKGEENIEDDATTDNNEGIARIGEINIC